MNSKPGIPVPATKDAALNKLLTMLKINVEMLTGARGGTIEPLSSTATAAEAYAKVNEIIARINVSGE